jgi:hypothetical protein
VDLLFKYIIDRYQRTGEINLPKSELLRYGPKPLRKADILDISVRHLLILGKLHIFKNGKKNLYTLMKITTV